MYNCINKMVERILCNELFMFLGVHTHEYYLCIGYKVKIFHIYDFALMFDIVLVCTVLPVGPIIQDKFLHNMGVVLRLQVSLIRSRLHTFSRLPKAEYNRVLKT